MFPHGCHLMPDSITEAQDYDEKTRTRTPAIDKLTGKRVLQCRVADMDPELEGRSRETVVKILADRPPVPPTGQPFELVEFDGLQVTPYVTGRARARAGARADGVLAARHRDQGRPPGRQQGCGLMPARRVTTVTMPVDGRSGVAFEAYRDRTPLLTIWAARPGLLVTLTLPEHLERGARPVRPRPRRHRGPVRHRGGAGLARPALRGPRCPRDVRDAEWPRPVFAAPAGALSVCPCPSTTQEGTRPS